MTVLTIGPKPASTGTIEPMDDLDVLSESDMCSCSAGDDNPY